MNENMMQKLLAENSELKQTNEQLWKIINVQKETLDKLWAAARAALK